MVGQIANLACASAHVRPFSLARDLGDLATLMQIAFAEDLALTGSRMVEEMRQMASLGPLAHLARLALPPIQGFVWTHGGRVVGNISITAERGGRWILSNVAVMPEMQGQGIGGCLVDVAIEHIRRRGGKQITLQVRCDNPVACALYARRGFEIYDTVHELRLERQNWPLVLQHPDASLRTPRWGDGPMLRALIQASTPPSAHPYQPAVAQETGTGLWNHLLSALRMLSFDNERISVVAAPQGAPVALACVNLRLLSSSHELKIHVAPTHRGAIERPLLGALFGRLAAAPQRDIRASISSSHPEALEALARLGFVTLRALDQMGRTLDGR